MIQARGEQSWWVFIRQTDVTSCFGALCWTRCDISRPTYPAAAAAASSFGYGFFGFPRASALCFILLLRLWIFFVFVDEIMAHR